MTEFFCFPHTPHLAWLGEGSPPYDEFRSLCQVTALLASNVVAEEKLDGRNVSLSLSTDGSLRAQNRGEYLAEPHAGQFSRFSAWLASHKQGVLNVLTPTLISFGEWCAAHHSLNYTALQDWFLIFDVYDRRAERFRSSARWNALARDASLVTVPTLLRGRTTITPLKQLVATKQSHYREGPLEGMMIRRESAEWCEARAKLVRPDFSQAIDTHWRKRALEWNRIVKLSGMLE